MRIKPIALANAFATLAFVLHPFFHIWGCIDSSSYERVMRGFVIGLRMSVGAEDAFGWTFFIYWLAEVAAFWTLGIAIAALYNRFAR